MDIWLIEAEKSLSYENTAKGFLHSEGKKTEYWIFAVTEKQPLGILSSRVL